MDGDIRTNGCLRRDRVAHLKIEMGRIADDGQSAMCNTGKNRILITRERAIADRLQHPSWPVYLEDAHAHWSVLAEDTTDAAELDEMIERFHKTFFGDMP